MGFQTSNSKTQTANKITQKPFLDRCFLWRWRLRTDSVSDGVRGRMETFPEICVHLPGTMGSALTTGEQDLLVELLEVAEGGERGERVRSVCDGGSRRTPSGSDSLTTSWRPWELLFTPQLKNIQWSTSACCNSYLRQRLFVGWEGRKQNKDGRGTAWQLSEIVYAEVVFSLFRGKLATVGMNIGGMEN